jgi:hypothetical protein
MKGRIISNIRILASEGYAGIKEFTRILYFSLPYPYYGAVYIPEQFG